MEAHEVLSKSTTIEIRNNKDTNIINIITVVEKQDDYDDSC